MSKIRNENIRTYFPELFDTQPERTPLPQPPDRLGIAEAAAFSSASGKSCGAETPSGQDRDGKGLIP